MTVTPWWCRVDSQRASCKRTTPSCRGCEQQLGGVTAAIDVGLHLVGRLAGEQTRLEMAAQMDDPYVIRDSQPAGGA